MKNQYEIRGDVTAIFIVSPKYGKQETLISTSKFARADEFPNSWFVTFDKKIKSFYVMGNLPRNGGKQKRVMFHRWISGAPSGMEVDHKNHDTLDNTDKNMRIVSHAENMQNKVAYTNSKSGVRGVSWREDNKKWQVKVQINRVQKHIGFFGTMGEAEQASVEARFKYMPYSGDSI